MVSGLTCGFIDLYQPFFISTPTYYRKVRRGLQDGEDPTTPAEMVSTATQTDKMTYEDIKSVADYLLKKTKIRPEVGIVCGSGLGGLADDLDEDKEKDIFPYKDIPKFPETTGAV